MARPARWSLVLLVSVAPLSLTPACGGAPISAPTPGAGALPAFLMPLADVHQCIPGGGWSYHLVGVTLHFSRTSPVEVRGDAVTIDVPAATLAVERFHAPLGCPPGIGPTDGAPARASFAVRYTGEVRQVAGAAPCVARSRAEYSRYQSDGFALAAVAIDPAIREQVWLGLDDVGLERVTGVARAPGAPGPRCADWTGS